LRWLKASLLVTKAHKGHFSLSRFLAFTDIAGCRSKEELGNDVGVDRFPCS
jgi:hypothetical protein